MASRGASTRKAAPYAHDTTVYVPSLRPPRRERIRANRAHRPTRRITLTASDVRVVTPKEVQVEFRSGDGIVDGQPIYRSLVDAPPSEDALVEFEVLTGAKRPLARDLATHLAQALPASACSGGQP